ncbi:hypothetical protein GYMLUDRAFT_40619 [Collybiopsis luxurians FD-317 M1]|uniref:MYND-type domain-containing protein n=1 Tax=Collybiopsis luxurians FD-317 M1 TaxID=944289 RepID=A0A0D0BHW4_9AGAR|nr:hypothetical protein GYMLUDRAFT_40619 [Collybiopsis luxurians FD-317 M1]
MRESNFAFPAQNKACVCITSQLYDRRALDTTSPLPLFNSLTHLTYLTSTSPRIREIMTMDGGLERLVRLLHEFCLCPPLPENPSLFYGLAPPSARTPKPLPTLNPPSFDKHAAYRFSLAFQCVVNIGVRGSEPIRSRVVQAGTLEVVGCILEAWLAHKGFAVGPNASGASGNSAGWGSYGRESREQRHARRQQQRQMLRDVEEAAELARALQRQMSHSESSATATASITEVGQDQDISAEMSASPDVDTLASGIEISSAEEDEGPVAISTAGRDRSGTVVARANWDPLGQQWRNVAAHIDTARSSPTPSISSNDQSRPSSRPHSETEDDADVDMDGPVPDSASTSATTSDIDASSPRNSRHRTHRPSMNRHTLVGLGLGGDQGPNMALGGIGHSDAHIIINDSVGTDGLGNMGDVGVNVGLGGGMTGEDGIVSLDIENNDDFAMGAPPGAPGAIPAANMGDVTLGLDADLSMSETEEASRPASRSGDIPLDVQGSRDMNRSNTIRRTRAPGTPDATPRAGVIGLPPSPSLASSSTGLNIPSSSRLPPSEPPTSSSLPSSSTIVPSPPSRSGTIRGISLDGIDITRELDGDGRSFAPWNASENNETLLIEDRSQETAQRGSLRPEDATRRAADGDIGRNDDRQNTLSIENPRRSPNVLATPGTVRSTASNISIASTAATASTSTTTHSLPPSPYRDEDVLLSLQLLAYLSKYPHVRQAFYKKRDSFHPATAAPLGGSASSSAGAAANATPAPSKVAKDKEPNKLIKESSMFFRAFAGASARGKEKERVNDNSTSSSATTPTSTTTPPRQTNVFSLVERFTYRPSSSEIAEYSNNGNPMNAPPRLPPEIQYWAGVIMRNACRKDDSRGGIRQCANMLCGRWEEYPREFAKCRRCRKAKYCGKECQSTAWSEGHRFWCSAKDAEDEATAAPVNSNNANGESSQSPLPNAGETSGADRRERRDRDRHTSERERRERAFATITGPAGPHRSRAFDPFGRAANDNPTASTSRAAEAVDRGLALFNLQRTQQGQAASRTRPDATTFGSSDVSEFEPTEVGRRRSETVTGIMTLASSTGRSDLTIPPYVPNPSQRSHVTRGPQEQSTSRLHRLLPARNDSVGESSRTVNEDHNMLLG